MVLFYLLDRIFWPTVVYLPISRGIYGLQDSLPENVRYGLTALFFLLWVNSMVYAFWREYKINALGSRAPGRRTYTPWNMGLLFSAVWYFSKHRNDEWWSKSWKGDKRSHPHTREATTLGARIIFTADEENIKAILAQQFGDYGKGENFRAEWKHFLGLSIFTTDGDLWHNSRQLLRPQFIKDRVSDLQKFEHHVQILLPLLAGNHNGAEVHVDDLFFRLSLDAATDFLLGHSVDSLRTSGVDFAQAFNKIQHTQALKSRLGPLKALAPKGTWEKDLKTLNSFINTYIDRALRLSPDELEKIGKSDDGYTFLHAIASYTREPAVLRDQIVAVLLAGRDTTAVTLSWLFYQLSRHPKVVRKLREEIINNVGRDRAPTYADLKSMRYLQHCLNEVLRLYPVVPYNVREALKDTTLPRGGGPDGKDPIGVLKGTPIGYSSLVLQRREDIYPDPSTGFPDINDFVPERWENWTPKPWTYIPFNGGTFPIKIATYMMQILT